jgi:hypothetical protein
LDSFLKHFLRNSSNPVLLPERNVVRTNKGWRYCKAAFHANGKIQPNVVVAGGVEEKYSEGRYLVNSNNRWLGPELHTGLMVPREDGAYQRACRQ